MKKLIEYKQLEKQFNFNIKSVDKEKNTVEGVFSTQDVDRQDEVIMQAGWDLTNYKNNPVVLYAHNYSDFPIAKMVEIGTEPNIRMPGTFQLVGKMQFAVEENPKAKTAFNLMAGGYLNTFSVGFKNNRWEVDEANDTIYLNENELLEVSVVPVPANQMALAKAKGIDTKDFEKDFKEKGVIPFADHGKAPEGTEWNGTREMQDAWAKGQATAKAICTWYDEAKPDIEASYKLPHHHADGLAAVWRGVAAAMGAVLGSRGGVDVPEGDRKGIYNHLAKHYAQFEKEVPEFKKYSAEELKEISTRGNISKETQAIETLSASTTETIKAAISKLTEILKTALADNQDGKKVETLKKGGTKKISVDKLNSAIRELLKVKKTINSK